MRTQMASLITMLLATGAALAQTQLRPHRLHRMGRGAFGISGGSS